MFTVTTLPVPGQDRASCHALVRDPPRTRLAASIETRVYWGWYAQNVKIALRIDRSTFTFGSVEVKPLRTNQQSQTEAPQFFFLFGQAISLTLIQRTAKQQSHGCEPMGAAAFPSPRATPSSPPQFARASQPAGPTSVSGETPPSPRQPKEANEPKPRRGGQKVAHGGARGGTVGKPK